MAIGHGERAHAGFKAEDATAREFVRQGKKVKQLPRNSRGHDMIVDGKKVEVKAAIETSYKGSDGYPITGYVFSNMHKDPSTDLYVLKCMSPDRKRVIKEYHMPASAARQRTLTITRTGGKYEEFLKKAYQDLPYDQYGRQIMQSDEKNALQREQDYVRNKRRELIGAATGTMIMLGPSRVKNIAMAAMGKSELKPVDFKTIVKASMGAAMGRQFARYSNH